MSKRRRAAQSQATKPAAARIAVSAPTQYGWLVPLALVALTVAAFAPVHGFGFVRFDDPDYVTNNDYVKAGLTLNGFTWAMTTGFIANWHPLTWLSHMMDVQLFGVNAGVHHLVNLSLHVINTLLLFAVLRQMTDAVGRSAFVAALFAIHPLHVESVAWISERKDMLSTLFWMLSLLSYVAFVQGRRARHYVGLLVFFGLGLLSKPMVVTLPFVLLLLDVWPLRRITLWHDGFRMFSTDDRSVAVRLVREKIPLFALAIVSSVITILVQRNWGAVGSTSAYPIGLRVENTFINYVAYIAKMLWPAQLSGFYPYRQSVSPLAAVAAALFLIAITIVVVRMSRERSYLLVGWLWYLGTLAPVIGIIQAGLQSIADRYTYIPLIGLFIVVAWGAFDLAEQWKLQRLVVPIVAVILVASGFRTYAQTQTWKDSLTFWQHSVDVTPESAYGQHNLGMVLVLGGRVDDGIARFREALRVDPNDSEVRIDLANALNQRGAVDDAIAEFDKVVRLRPEYAEAHVAYGSLLRTRGRTAEAIAQFQEALRRNPSLANAHNELGNALTADGRNDDAIEHYAEAIKLTPTFAEAHNNLGAAYMRIGKFDPAIGEFLEALRLKPNDAMFHYNAALTLERLGRTQDAVEHLKEALRAEPTNDAARRALARLSPGSGE